MADISGANFACPFGCPSVVDGFDIADLFGTLIEDCTRLLGVDSVGMLLADGKGELQVAAASSGVLHMVELHQVRRQEGPCLDCYRTGVPVLVTNRAAADRAELTDHLQTALHSRVVIEQAKGVLAQPSPASWTLDHARSRGARPGPPPAS